MSKDHYIRELKNKEEELEYRKQVQYCFTLGNNYDSFSWPHHGLHTEWMYGMFSKKTDEMVAGMHNIPMKMKIRGVDCMGYGLAGITVMPEHRNERYTGALVLSMLRNIKKLGAPIALGFPFKYSFYDRIKAALVENHKLLKFNPNHLRRWKPSYKIAQVFELDDIKKVYKKACEKVDYCCRREDFQWVKLTENTYKFVIYDENKEPKGYVISRFVKKGMKLHRSIRSVYNVDKLKRCLEIIELEYLDTKAKQTCFNYMWSHRDQIDNVLVFFPEWEKLTDYFVELHLVETMVRSRSMARISDIQTFLNLMKFDKSIKTEMTFKVIDDDICLWNNGVYKMKIEDGKCKVEVLVDHKNVAAHKEEVDCVIPLIGLTKMFMGFRTASDLYSVEPFPCKKDVIEKLDKLFPIAKNFLRDTF